MIYIIGSSHQWSILHIWFTSSPSTLERLLTEVNLLALVGGKIIYSMKRREIEREHNFTLNGKLQLVL